MTEIQDKFMFLLSNFIYYEAKTRVLPSASWEEGDLILQSHLVPRIDKEQPCPFRLQEHTSVKVHSATSNGAMTGYTLTLHHPSPTEMKLQHLQTID